jgi:3-hydroxy acid dehydrogenase/malonic semialdehyde reductase
VIRETDSHAGKAFIVTGASSGIGNAVAVMLLNNNARVIALAGRGYRNSAPQSEMTGDVTVVHCELGIAKDIEDCFSSIAKNEPRLDGVILCHGYGDFGSIEEFSSMQIQELVNVNLISNMLICRIIIPILKKQKRGDVILMGSESGLKGGKKGAVYCATKFGINGFVEALREECAASGIRVSVVNPGMVKTSFFDKLDFVPGEDRDNYLLGEDVANAVSLLLEMPQGTVIDKINLSPQKKVIRKT